MGLRTARGVLVAPASSDPDAVRGAFEVAHALAGNLKYLRRRPAAARRPHERPPGPGVFDVIDAGERALHELDSQLPVLLVAAEGAELVTPPDAPWILGVIARSRPVPAAGELTVMGVFPPLPGGPDDPVWLGKAADFLESRVDLWPVLQVAAPG